MVRSCIHLSIGILLAVLSLPFATSASPGFSPNITVDTRGYGDLTVTGRVLNGLNHLPLPGGALISLAGQNTTTAANGTFTLANVNLAAGATLTASASGYAAQTRAVSAAEGVKSVDVGSINLVPPGSGPVVEWVRLEQESFFLSGWGVSFQVRARVNWNGASPQGVAFYAKDRLVRTETGGGPEYAATFSVDEHFAPSLGNLANSVRVVATGTAPGAPGTPQVSLPYEMEVVVLPLPASLAPFAASAPNKTSQGSKLKLSVAFPPESDTPAGAYPLPILGTMSGKIQAEGEFSYDFQSRQWELAFGAKTGSKSKFDFGFGPLTGLQAGLKGKAAGSASKNGGIQLSNVSIIGNLALSGKFALGSYGPFGLLGPQLTQLVLDTPVVNEAFRSVTILVWLKPGLAGQVTLQVHPQMAFQGMEMTGKVALEAAYEPQLTNDVNARFYLGGEPSVRFALPGPFFRELRARAYAGMEVSVWVLGVDYEYVFMDVRYPEAQGATEIAAMLGQELRAVPAAANASASWKLSERSWRQAGPERFQAGETTITDLEAEKSGMETFVLLGQAKTERKAADGPSPMVIPGDEGLPVGVELPMLENVLPSAEPSLASHEDRLMLVYVRDTGAENAVQYTEIAFTYFNGAAWSAPAAVVQNDPRGQFNPQVAFDGDGNAVVVYERMKDAAFNGSSLSEVAAQMEIVWSRWDVNAGQWSVPQALTDNHYLDFNICLAGPLANGDLLLTWNQNEANQLHGSGEPGAPGNLRVMSAKWSRAAQSWSAPQTLLGGLVSVLSQSLAAAGSKGVFVWTWDLDGDTDDNADAELYFKIYDDTQGNWGPTVRHTNDSLADRNAHVVMNPAGDTYAIWNRAGNLVMDVNFSGVPSLVRSGSSSLGLENFAATMGPGGNVVLIWQEMNEEGSDAHYRVFDPASATWGKDAFLSQDSDLERSFAPVWDAAGNLTLAYNNVEIVKETKSVVVEGGEVIEVEGVPQPGRVDLLLAKRRLVKDVTLVPEGLTADGTNFLPGDEVTLRARVRNAGNLAVQDLQVAFYDGDPDAGGEIIATEVIPGWLEAQDEAEVSYAWVVPQPVQARTVFVVVDPDNEVTEADESNNRLALPINGVDLALEYQSGSALRDGSARVVVKVRNLSAPDSPVSMLKLKDLNSGVTLAETSVSQLAPGQSVDVPFDLPAGTQPEGDRAYVLVIDEEELVEDIDRENNEAPFALNLWIDDDGDGIPRWWELLHSMSDNNPGDAHLDLDGDGFMALQEYLAGTDPNNFGSRLEVGQYHVSASTVEGSRTSQISWASVQSRLYRVQRSFDLKEWTTIIENVEGTPPLNTVMDTCNPPEGRLFYKVSAQ